MKLLSRREFIKTLAVGSSCLAIPNISLSGSSFGVVKTISIKNQHTNETLKNVTFCERGEIVESAMQEIAYVMRDHRNNEIKEIDPDLLNFLFRIKNKLNFHDNFQIVSAYRSPKTNALLRKKSTKVAKNSLHMQGRALDISFSGSKLLKTRDIARSLRLGGVGCYPKSNFIHIDTGNVRFWGA